MPILVIGKFRLRLTQRPVLSAALSCIAVAHFMVYVEVRSEIPLHIFRYIIHTVRRISFINSRARGLGILSALLQQVGRCFGAFRRCRARISIGIVGLHSVGDVKVALHSVILSHPSVFSFDGFKVVVWGVGKRGGVMSKSSSFDYFSVTVVNRDFLTADPIFMITRIFGGCRIPVVFLHHRTVIFAQCLNVRERHTHHLPSVLVKQDDLRSQ